MSLEIEKTLVLSTSHITLNDSILLEKHKGEGGIDFAIIDSNKYSWSVYLQGPLSQELSAAFFKVVKCADDLNCNWIRFDRDGSTTDLLETFDW